MPVELKTNYVVDQNFAAFFTGGRACSSSDGKYLFTTCGNIISVLNPASGRTITTIGAKDTEDTIACFVPRYNSVSVVIAYRNALLKQWSAVQSTSATLTFRAVRTWRSGHVATIQQMTFSDDDRLLATGGGDSVVKIWDLELQYCTHTLKGVIGVIGAIAFEPIFEQNRRIFYGGDDGKLVCWNLTKNEHVGTIDVHSSVITTVAVSGRKIITVSRDKVIGIFSCDTLAQLRLLPAFETLEVLLVANNSTGKIRFITGGENGVLKLWSAATGKCLRTSEEFHSRILGLFRFHVDDDEEAESQSRLIVVTEDHIIRFLKEDDFTVVKNFVGYNDEILDVALLANERLAVGANAKELRVYERASGDTRIVPGHTDTIMSLDTPPWNRNLLASGSKDSTIRIWQLNDSGDIENVALATGHTGSVTAVRFAPLQANFLVSVSADTTLKVWKLPDKFDSEVQKLRAAATLAAHSNEITCVDVSVNNRLVATGSMDKTVQIWNLSRELRLQPIGAINAHKRGVCDVRFSGADQVVATASADWTVKIFALRDYSCLKTFEGHEAAVTRVRFLPHGLQIVSCDLAGLIKIWAIKSGECMKTLDEHSSKIWAMEFNDTASHFVTGGAESKLVVWRDVSEEDKTGNLLTMAKMKADEQSLSNLINQKLYGKALAMAILLGRPRNAFKILKMLLTEENGRESVNNIIQEMSSEQLSMLLDWIVEWNTNGVTSLVAQFALAAVLAHVQPEKLLELPNIKHVIESTIPYSERHFERYTRLRQQTSFVQYTWQRMRLLDSATDSLSTMTLKLDDV